MRKKRDYHLAVYLDELHLEMLKEFARQHATTLSTAARMLIVMGLNEYPKLIKETREKLARKVKDDEG